MTEKVKRKPFAIPSAEAKGYNRLIAKDEESTVRILNENSETVFNHVFP